MMTTLNLDRNRRAVSREPFPYWPEIFLGLDILDLLFRRLLKIPPSLPSISLFSLPFYSSLPIPSLRFSLLSSTLLCVPLSLPSSSFFCFPLLLPLPPLSCVPFLCRSLLLRSSFSPVTSFSAFLALPLPILLWPFPFLSSLSLFSRSYLRQQVYGKIYGQGRVPHAHPRPPLPRRPHQQNVVVRRS